MEITIWRTPGTLFVCNLSNENALKEKRFVRIKAKLIRGKEFFVRDILYCECNKEYFILYDKKEELNMFCDYKLIDAITGKVVHVNCSTNWKEPKKECTERVIWKNRASREWYYAHPYQGGSCSGR